MSYEQPRLLSARREEESLWQRPAAEAAAPATITTTLDDLLAALQDVVHPGEEALVMASWCPSYVRGASPGAAALRCWRVRSRHRTAVVASSIRYS
jgi:hypothetical protein